MPEHVEQQVSGDGQLQGRPSHVPGVVAALRYRGEEVQFTRVLAAVCQHREASRALVGAVLGEASGGHTKAPLPVPEDIICVSENVIRGRPSRRAAKDDRIDLSFESQSSSWRLHVELKINAALDQEQIAAYGRDAPVAAVVRDPQKLKIDPRTPGWIGAASWPHLLPSLKALPVPAEEQVVWTQLLDVMVADGDLLAATAVTEEAQAAAVLLRGAADQILQHATRRLASRSRMSPRVLAAIASARVITPTARDPWSGLSLDFNGDCWWWFAVRRLFAPAPEVFVWFYPSPGRRSERSARDAAVRLATRGRNFQRLTHGYRWRSHQPALHCASAAALADWCRAELDIMQRAGVYRDDVALESLTR